jgi:hypothetical protein
MDENQRIVHEGHEGARRKTDPDYDETGFIGQVPGSISADRATVPDWVRPLFVPRRVLRGFIIDVSQESARRNAKWSSMQRKSG